MSAPRQDFLTIACIADPTPRGALLAEAIATLLPWTTLVEVDTAAQRELPAADLLVIDGEVHGVSAIDLLRTFRARGFDGPAVLVLAAADPEMTSLIRQLGGFACIEGEDLVVQLSVAMAAALRMVDAGAGGLRLGAAIGALRHTQRVLAVGEVAQRLQHSLNNPLAALLAEAQILELEELGPEHMESVRRIVELTRRVISLIRGLDGMGVG